MKFINSSFIFFVIFFLIMPSAFSDQKIKKPNVSGQFYTADAKQLSSEIDQYLAQADVKPYDQPIDIMIAPHAGYIYSGQVAAHGFKAVSQGKYNTIVILAPSHFVGFDGMSVWNEGGFQTPLGVVPVDQEFAQKLIKRHDHTAFIPEAFAREHSLEVEIPFLQKTFSDFQIVPVIMGQPTFQTLQDFAKVLQETIGSRNDVLVVVSTDLSHYHDDKTARNMDRQAVDAIKQQKAEQIFQECRERTMEMCGCVPVVAALLYAKEKGLSKVDVLNTANSGDTSGDSDRVVGYASIVIYADNSSDASLATELSLPQKQSLINIAKDTIWKYIQEGKAFDVKETDPRLHEEEGAFVTIHKQGRLRGCIGNIIGRGPLYLTVRDMAIAAAINDPRFKPLEKEELTKIDIEVSVLSKPWRIKNVDEIQMGRHGVIVRRGPSNQGIFLPQVATETGWTKEEFLNQLCSQKARLPADCWKDPKTQIDIFTADVFSEK